ncbi:hypothetical protein D8674_029014 [Pyrus ussuriensis x Pyrus communis]|uniref:Uncharacterized protein n=1 Tax=Pyrus ussuriensis x Pyrus communis TaxID=2448454 RepID=A0A5N5I0W6_9ROSA|nr:hypothetical protein D8674_029014 [Pyrus ussuriensis x Pyrus communis]
MDVSRSDTTTGIGLHQRRSSIAHWPTTLVTSFGPIALCNGNLERRFQTRRTTISTTSTTICWRTSTGTSLNGPKEFEDREDNWVWLCSHFQAPSYVNKAKANKSNREKKTLLHNFGSMPFSYRMEGGSKFVSCKYSLVPFIFLLFSDVYVRPGNELAESLHESASQLPPETLLKSVDPPEDVGFQIFTETLDQTFKQRLRTYCSRMGNAWRPEPRASSSSQRKGEVTAVTTLTAEVDGLKTKLASYKGQMSLIVQAFSQSGIHLLHMHPPSTSEPLKP